MNDDLNEIPHNVTHVIDDLNTNADFTSYNYSADHAHALKHNIHTPSHMQKPYRPLEVLAAQAYVIVNQDLTGGFINHLRPIFQLYRNQTTDLQNKITILYVIETLALKSLIYSVSMFCGKPKRSF